MVFFALTPEGFTEALRLANGAHPVWCSATAVSHEELAAMSDRNVSLVLLLGAVPAGGRGRLGSNYPVKPYMADRIRFRE